MPEPPNDISVAASTLYVLNLGCVDYQRALRLQECLRDVVLHGRELYEAGQSPHLPPNCLLLCTHPHVYTVGRRSNPEHLLFDAAQMRRQGVQVCPTNRGGQITYHGPGQRVGYPILDMRQLFLDVERYVRLLETIVIAVLRNFSISGVRVDGATGVWVAQSKDKPCKKICAMGVRVSRWVTMHGLALNVCPDLRFFDHIVACGLPERKATSMADVLSNRRKITLLEVACALIKNFSHSVNQSHRVVSDQTVHQLFKLSQGPNISPCQMLEVLCQPR